MKKFTSISSSLFNTLECDWEIEKKKKNSKNCDGKIDKLFCLVEERFKKEKLYQKVFGKKLTGKITKR